LDFNSKVFEETSSKYTIEKFYRAKQIIVLEIFFLRYYLSKKQVRAHLFEYSQKFLSIIDIYFYKYKDKVFYIKKKQVIEIFIKSRIIVNIAYFREENPNYTRLNIKKSNRGLLLLLSS
jgi:hypothetical protein